MRSQIPSLERPTILVVDDDAALCSSLRFSLELEGFVVRTYLDGPELLREPEMPRVGCMVIDQKLPTMNGLAVLEGMRRRQVQLPAILITTHPNALVRQAAKLAGVRIVEKPLLGNALSEEIRRVLSPPPETDGNDPRSAA